MRTECRYSKNKNATKIIRTFTRTIITKIVKEEILFFEALINATGSPPRSSLIGRIVRIIPSIKEFILINQGIVNTFQP